MGVFILIFKSDETEILDILSKSMYFQTKIRKQVSRAYAIFKNWEKVNFKVQDRLSRSLEVEKSTCMGRGH